jgi:hypothetical protein
MYCEKEGFNPLWKAVNLANRWDVLIISNKGQSVTAARKLIDVLCGDYDLPLFVLHDFDVAGFSIAGVLQRDTRRYQFANAIEVIDLGLRLADIGGLEREPAAATKVQPELLRRQLADDGATPQEIAILMRERVELNAMTSDALVALVEAGFRESGVPQKATPDGATLIKAYRAFSRSLALRKKFEEMEKAFDKDAEEVGIPADLGEQVETVLAKHDSLRWDDALQVTLDESHLGRVLRKKADTKQEAGDFTGDSVVDEIFSGILGARGDGDDNTGE